MTNAPSRNELDRRIVESWQRHDAAEPDISTGRLMAMVEGDGVAFAALALREGVCRSYFTRVVRLSYRPGHHPSDP